MPRFQPDMTKARASTRIFDRGEYLLKCTKATPFIYEREKDGVVVAGFRYGFEVQGTVDGDGALTADFKGERTSDHRVYIHTEAAWGMAKGFIMACAGYSSKEEDKFDEEWVPEHSFNFEGEPEDNEDELEVGDAWTFPVGRLVLCRLDKGIYKNPTTKEEVDQQNFAEFSPSRDVS